MPAAYRGAAGDAEAERPEARRASAFGCGAFRNPPAEVARIYSETLRKYADDLDVVVFAIFYPGYGEKDNFHAFAEVFKNFNPLLDEDGDVVPMKEDVSCVSGKCGKEAAVFRPATPRDLCVPAK